MSVAALDHTLAQVPPGSARADVLEAARQFKSNWVELGEKLARVLDEQQFRQWGFDSFDKYVTAELRLKRDTAYKLVRSYTFVRTAKPEYLSTGQLPPVEVVDFLSKKRDAEALPAEQMDSFTAQAFENNWTPRTISQKWRDLVSDEREAVAEDKSVKVVRRATELCDRLQKALVEIPGLDPELLDSAQKIRDALAEQIT